MAKILLEMKNITKTFPGVKALDNVNLQVEEGEIHALVGENGAGKSTLARVICGDIKPTKGSIILNEKKLNIRKPKDAIRRASKKTESSETLGLFYGSPGRARTYNPSVNSRLKH